MAQSSYAQLIHRILTGMLKGLTRFFRRVPDDPQTVADLWKRVLRLEIHLGRMHDELAALEGRHATLAKRTYGREGGRPKAAGDAGIDDQHLTKAQLRQRLGLVPGRPYQPRLEDSAHGN